MEVTKGFKQTEAGMIPNDWTVDLLGRFVTIKSGSSPSTIHFTSDGHPYFKVEQLGWAQKHLTRSDTQYHFVTGPLVPKRSIIFAKRGGAIALNKVRILGEDSFMDTNLMALTPSSLLSTEYLYYFLVQRKLSAFADTTSVPQINNKHINPLPIPVPPTLEEQEAIATALSDADAWIESLEQLIAKKRQIKQGAMQELLTGKRRLPGFSGEWEVKSLGDLCWYQEGPGVRNTQFTSSGVKLLNGTNIFRGSLVLDTTTRFISSQEAYGPYLHFLADEGDIVIASSGISIDRFHEKVAFVKASDLPFCMNTSTIRFKAGSAILSKSYLFHYLCSSDFKKQIGGEATGSAQLNFGPSHLSRVRLATPPLSEQVAIAEVLTDIDTELALSETKLFKARQIKQGMMQELLTGRIRLI